jgi:hypothetical protein
MRCEALSRAALFDLQITHATSSPTCHVITHMSHHHTHATSSHAYHIITHMSHHHTHATSSHAYHIITHMSHHHTHVTSSHTCHVIRHMSRHHTHVTSSHTCLFDLQTFHVCVYTRCVSMSCMRIYALCIHIMYACSRIHAVFSV